MPICGELHAVGKPSRQISHEFARCRQATAPDAPARYQLCVRVYSYPLPYITETELPSLIGGYVLSFRVAERPDFIALNALRCQVEANAILEFSTGRADLGHQLEHCIKRHVAHAGGSADGITLNEGRNYLASLFPG
jgi:hypothetical protein